MPKILVAVDGSDSSARALKYVIDQGRRYREPLEIHLLNVQYPLHGDVRMFLSNEQVRDFHHDEGVKALESAREAMDAAQIPYVFHIGVGDPAEVIAQYATDKACDQIVMGTRGLGRIAGMLMGSVATKVIHLTSVPVLLIK